MTSTIIAKLLMIPGMLIGLCFHEYAHAKVSYIMGDPTPMQQGRVTLNPMAHVDPIGFVALLLFGFGWGKPVAINPSYYKNRRRDELLVALAGVTMNLLIAVVFAALTRLVYSMYIGNPSDILNILYTMLFYVVNINVCLMIFNLLPVPPLDGWGIITQIFNLENKSWYYTIYRYGSLILLALIVFNITDYIITPLISKILGILLY